MLIMKVLYGISGIAGIKYAILGIFHSIIKCTIRDNTLFISQIARLCLRVIWQPIVNCTPSLNIKHILFITLSIWIKKIWKNTLEIIDFLVIIFLI